jgi:hypothetical protein
MNLRKKAMNSQILFSKYVKTNLLRLILAGILSLTVGMAGIGQTPKVAAEGLAQTVDPPSNDQFPGTLFTGIPFNDLNVNTTAATTQIGVDPASIFGKGDCNSNEGEASVWYNYTPGSNISLAVDTIGSSAGYDTLVAIWKDVSGTLSLIACNDDISLYEQHSRAVFLAEADTTYYIEVIDYAGPAVVTLEEAGGILNFHVSEYIPPEIVPPADFDGNGNTDITIFRPSNGLWAVKDQFYAAYGMLGDIPVAGDYNGDGTADVAIFRPSNGLWAVKDQFYAAYGMLGDIPVPGDYNGDGTTDVAIFRPSNGLWAVKDQFYAVHGMPGDIPVPGDYNGDGVTDVTIFRPSNGLWAVKDQFYAVYGMSGDIPVPGDYNTDGVTDVTIFRPSNGLWAVKDQFYAVYGMSGDIPVPYIPLQ